MLAATLLQLALAAPRIVRVPLHATVSRPRVAVPPRYEIIEDQTSPEAAAAAVSNRPVRDALAVQMAMASFTSAEPFAQKPSLSSLVEPAMSFFSQHTRWGIMQGCPQRQ